MIKPYKSFFSATLWFLSTDAFAGCDACLQAAIEQARAQISSSLTVLEQSVSSNVQATQTLNQTITQSNSALTGLMEVQHRLLLQSLEAATVRLEAAQTVQASTIQSVGDHIAKTIYQTTTGIAEAQTVLHNDEVYGERSIPISAQVSADRAPLLQEAITQYNQQLAEANIAFKEWYFSVAPGDNAITRRKVSVQNKIEALTPNVDALINQLLTDEQTSNLLELFRLTLLPEPQDISVMSIDEALNYRAQYHQLAFKYNTLATYVLKRAPLLKTDNWHSNYVIVNEHAGKTSIQEFLHAESDRKLFSKDWYLNISTRTTAGLLREQAHATAMGNYLLGELLEAQNARLSMITGEQ
jgi:hypothetical protein